MSSDPALAAGSVAGAFSGLIAYGVAQIDSKIAAWRILFAVEGLPSLALAVVVFFCLPSRPDKTRYLNESQRTVACTRLNAHSQGNERMGIQWAAVRYALSDWRLRKWPCQHLLPPALLPPVSDVALLGSFFHLPSLPSLSCEPIRHCIKQYEAVRRRLERKTMCLNRKTSFSTSQTPRGALADARTTVVLCISYSAMNLTLGSVSGFLPTIV